MSDNQDHHRLSTEEEDLVHRSAKKIKDKPSLELQPEEIVRMVTEELFPDMDISNNNDHGDMEFDPNPNVHVEFEEYENWCGPWKYSLIVRLMGKRVEVAQHVQSISNDMQGSTPQEKKPQADGDETVFGPWMLAKKISRKRPQAYTQPDTANVTTHDGENSSKSSFESASRFEALQSYQEKTEEASIKPILEKKVMTSTQTSLKHSFDGPRVFQKNLKAASLEPKAQEIPEVKDKQKNDDWEKEVLVIMSRYNTMRWEAHSRGEFVGDPLSMDNQHFRSLIYGNSSDSTMQDVAPISNLDRPPDTTRVKGKESVSDGKEGTQPELNKLPEGPSSTQNK
ncbi:hypothetical protein SESBI_00826 [Sesbania bispinosa]|nr:hypothetical protein SESBI_00826 [Sesbania bispinosa]